MRDFPARADECLTGRPSGGSRAKAGQTNVACDPSVHHTVQKSSAVANGSSDSCLFTSRLPPVHVLQKSLFTLVGGCRWLPAS